MDLSYSHEHEAFRAEVRAFCSAHADRAPKSYLGEEARAWQRLLIEHGYAARTVPKQYGGYGAEPDLLKSRIIAEEFLAAGLPMGMSNQGISMLVPTLLELGSEEQKKRWIGPTLRGEVIWCQGYSEPGAGSDLAALTTRATEDGDDFVINGQKIWTSTAAQADMIFCLVRTEPDKPKHEGISYLIFSMKTPGIEVRPLVTMTGRAEFNEVFFSDVRVPKTQIVGQRGQGWLVANATLRHERGMLGDPNQAGTRLHAVIRLMEEEQVDGRRLMDNPVLRDHLLKLQARVLAMEMHGLRLLTAAAKGEDLGLARLIVKLQGCELNHQLAGFANDLLGELGILYGDSPHLRSSGEWQTRFMFDLGLIIGGGTAQIQKNIIAERGLGMPREPKAAG
ncbi:MAG: acyl-CoA dehydrogenase family protein [Alphaproteobacteria bacterium]|nr:acyl-CoA dehydrogenase family protein [Alphaproteobacteria bacterium]MBV9694790.1 acyl-CoA dehydrogenase family protein [Alphaproteobacteria bacterium]